MTALRVRHDDIKQGMALWAQEGEIPPPAKFGTNVILASASFEM
jgi:hypothetical protein